MSCAGGLEAAEFPQWSKSGACGFLVVRQPVRSRCGRSPRLAAQYRPGSHYLVRNKRSRIYRFRDDGGRPFLTKKKGKRIVAWSTEPGEIIGDISAPQPRRFNKK